MHQEFTRLARNQGPEDRRDRAGRRPSAPEPARPDGPRRLKLSRAARCAPTPNGPAVPDSRHIQIYIGETTVTCSATDIPGNSALGSFNVAVRDTTPPTILGVLSEITEEATGPNGAKVIWQPPIAKDAVDGSLDVHCTSDSGLTSGDTFPLGTTRVICETMDQTDKAVESFEVKVSDTTPPEIVGVPDDMTVTVRSARGAIVTFDVTTAIDEVDGDMPVRRTPELGGVFPLGTTTVTCTATDSRGNAATASFNVSITYAWSGVLKPLNADGTSIFKLVATVPVKFGFTGDSADITNAVAKLYERRRGGGRGRGCLRRFCYRGQPLPLRSHK